MGKKLLSFAMLMIVSGSALAQTGSRMKSSSNLPAGYWPLEKSQPIIDKMQTIRLAPDMSHLSEGELKAVVKLLEVGRIFQSLYEKQRHPQALSAQRDLVQLEARTASTVAIKNLLTLYRLNQGPIATTLENKREPSLPVDPVEPGKNMYPWGVKKDEIEDFLKENPQERDKILGQRSVVRAATLENLSSDLSRLKKYPVLATLHPGLQDDLSELVAAKIRAGSRMLVPRSGDKFYAIPYSLAYADELTRA